MKNLLWLDDYRNPFDIETDWLIFSPIGRDVNVNWVKSYYEFCEWIKTNGLPDAICFDHDLGKLIETELLKNGYSKKEARKMKGQEKNGYDCAKFLVEYCLDNNLKIPSYSIQSANPVGRENISCLLENYNASKA